MFIFVLYAVGLGFPTMWMVDGSPESNAWMLTVGALIMAAAHLAARLPRLQEIKAEKNEGWLYWTDVVTTHVVAYLFLTFAACMFWAGVEGSRMYSVMDIFGW